MKNPKTGATKEEAADREVRIRETQKCPRCRNFAWHDYMEPMRRKFLHDWHHPACPMVAGAPQ
jgi:hypothetical protein